MQSTAMHRLRSRLGRESINDVTDALTLMSRLISSPHTPPAPQSTYGSDFSAIVTNMTGSTRDGWSRESTHAHAVRPPILNSSPTCNAVTTPSACHDKSSLLHANLP